jgi:hypothetical protein
VAAARGLHRAYVSARVLNTGNGLRDIPMIAQHGMGDPETNGDIHLKFYSFSIRERLENQNARNLASGNTNGPNDIAFTAAGARLLAIDLDTDPRVRSTDLAPPGITLPVS